MKIIFLSLFLSLALWADDFITMKEYAKMLYENPRGISCSLCHNNDGSGRVLGTYTQKDKTLEFRVESIQNISLEDFKKALHKTQDAKSIMPTYSLTDEEIIVLYNYIKELSKEKK